MSGPPELGVGDVVRVARIRTVAVAGMREAGWIWLDFKPPKGRRFVFLLLGDEPADESEPINPTEALKALGWTLPEED